MDKHCNANDCNSQQKCDNKACDCRCAQNQCANTNCNPKSNTNTNCNTNNNCNTNCNTNTSCSTKSSTDCSTQPCCPCDILAECTGIKKCETSTFNGYCVALPHGLDKSDIKITASDNLIKINYEKEIKNDNSYSSRTGSYSFTIPAGQGFQSAHVEGDKLLIRLEKGAKTNNGPLPLI